MDKRTRDTVHYSDGDAKKGCTDVNQAVDVAMWIKGLQKKILAP